MRKQHNPRYADLIALVPAAPGWSIDWPAIWSLWPELPALDQCPQDPKHHQEGDVGLHTRMVAQALTEQPDWRALPSDERALLFWAVVLHDIGKPATTRHEDDGRITSRGHSRVGAVMARNLLWRASAPFEWREALCGIIQTHQSPFWLIARDDPKRLAIMTSWSCRGDHLCLHARADALGRICADQAAVLENVALARLTFDETGCLTAPYPFANAESRLTYFDREDRAPDFPAHEDHRCTVTVMSGLPGAGKDRWINDHGADQPMVSLDQIRRERKIAPSANQGQVIQAAHESARQHLRAGQNFIWNATNITAQTRARVLRLLRDYNARIRIVYIEPDYNRLFSQNRNRDHVVPTEVMLKLAAKLEPPTWAEAHEVTYLT